MKVFFLSCIMGIVFLTACSSNNPRSSAEVLKSREFLAFTYYNKIKNSVGPTWESMMKSKVKQLPEDQKVAFEKEERIVKVAGEIDETGALQKIHLQQSSGFSFMDEVALAVFKEKSPFSKPPRSILKDGIVSLDWKFIVPPK